ncbi:MAG: hypothetical protein LBL45_10615, partial [Treponema sp.]|nr:hypothetical protein [Treponema sp.]
AKRIGLSTQKVKEHNRAGCKLAARRPMAAKACIKNDTPEIEENSRIVKCHLYAHKTTWGSVALRGALKNYMIRRRI